MIKIARKSFFLAFIPTVLLEMILVATVLDVPERATEHFVEEIIIKDGVIVIPPSRIAPEPIAPEPKGILSSDFLWTALTCLWLVLYFAPTFFAYINKVRTRRWLFLANLLAGWTIIGWIICFVWAFSFNRDTKFAGYEEYEEKGGEKGDEK